jgi:hypothetical protein
MEVTLAAIVEVAEHRHLPPGLAVIAIAVCSMCMHNDRHSQIERVIHCEWQTPPDRSQHMENGHLPIVLHMFPDEGSSSTPLIVLGPAMSSDLLSWGLLVFFSVFH